MDNDAKNRLLAQLRAAAKEHLDGLSYARERAIEKMQALGAHDDAAARKTLLSYLIQSENDLLRPLAASRLGEIGGDDVMRELVVLLGSVQDESICVLIIQVLAEIGNPEASPALIHVLQDTTYGEARQRAALALGKTGGEAAYEALMSVLDTENHIKTRQQVIEALGWLGDERCIPDVVQIMQTDPDKETQTFAAEALGRIGSERCYAPLLDTLQNHNYLPIVRYYAAYGLGLLGDTRAIEPLKQIAADASEHSWVAQMASESLDKLTPQY